tara:strand:+ start:1589 stop:1960 length:372 start_codon:yes stop_codon:yes gene_type:complete
VSQAKKIKTKKSNSISFDRLKYKESYKQEALVALRKKEERETRFGYIPYLSVSNADKMSDEQLFNIDNQPKDKCMSCGSESQLDGGYCQNCESAITGEPPSDRGCPYDAVKYSFHNSMERGIF